MANIDEIDLPIHSHQNDDAFDAHNGPAVPATSAEDDDDDAELEAMKARVAEMEAEAAKLRQMQDEADKDMASAAGSARPSGPTEEEKEEVDARSVYVGNVSESSRGTLARTYGRKWSSTSHRGTTSCTLTVSPRLRLFVLLQVDYGATPEEIQQHFQSCGNINRVTILCDKFTGHPKGSVALALQRGKNVQAKTDSTASSLFSSLSAMHTSNSLTRL